ncbi:translation initiation factor IF-2 [Methylobacterium sp. WL7]|nr:translation initiation factor IF-2 [Methylobacterium sp. WL7]
MLQRSLTITASAALALGLATVAHASLTAGASDPRVASEPRLDAHQTYAESVTPAPVTRSLSAASRRDAGTQIQTNQAAPRVVDLPRADAPSQGYASSAADAQTKARSEQLSQVKPIPASQVPAGQTPSVAPDLERVPAAAKTLPYQTAGPARPAGYRPAKWSAGEGASWRTGRDAYGFSGTFGGCRIRGTAGPHGYRLDRAC